MIQRYDSLAQFVEVAKDCPNGNASYTWCGNISHNETVQLALNGDDKLVPEAEKLLEKLDSDIEIARPEWVPSIAGAFPSVPDYLAGLPDSMRTMHPTMRDTTPVSIYVSTTSSAGIDADTMMKRGVAILALLMKLQQMRPVQLFLLAELHGRTDGEYLQVIRIESTPLNLSTACFVLTHVGFARHLTYGVAHAKDSFNGQWPRMYDGGGSQWEEHVREVLGMNPQDVYVGAARIWDDVVRRPVEWVNKQVAQFVAKEDWE